MSTAITGTVTLAYVAKAAVNDASAPDGARLIDQIAIEFRAAADDAQYTFNLTPNTATPALEQIQRWRADGTRVTVFCSSIRAQPFVHDTVTKGPDGKPKSYPKAGKKVQVVGLVGNKPTTLDAEIDAFLTFQAYDIQPAGTFDLEEVAKKAHGANLAQREQYLADIVARKQQKSLERATKQLEGTRARKTAQASQTTKKSA